VEITVRHFFLHLLLALFSIAAYSQEYKKEHVGKIERQLLTEDPEFKKWFIVGYNEYQPKDSFIVRLRPLLIDKKIVVVMGTWCSDSQLDIPHLINLLDEVEFDRTRIDIWGVDRNKTSPADVLSKYEIKYVPTIIVFDKNGKEVARIVEKPEVTLEQDLIKLLSGETY
jgi:thiol-disulfide isomerase/thioredoxin